MKNNMYKAILLGAAWGIFEATVGYLLHFYGIKIGSYIWFPIAYFFVHKAYRYTGSLSAAMLTAFIAAALKLVNLLLPGRVDMVINPAVSIILEALAVVMVYKYVINREMDKINPFTIALTGFIWRGLYVFYIFSMPRAYFDISSFTAMESFLEFIFVKNIITIAIISAGFYMGKVFSRQLDGASTRLRERLGKRAVLNPAIAAGSVAIAAAVQFFIG